MRAEVPVLTWIGDYFDGRETVTERSGQFDRDEIEVECTCRGGLVFSPGRGGRRVRPDRQAALRAGGGAGDRGERRPVVRPGQRHRPGRSGPSRGRNATGCGCDPARAGSTWGTWP